MQNYLRIKSTTLEKKLQTCAKKCNNVVEEDPTMSKVFKEKVNSFVARANIELANEKEELFFKNRLKAVMRFYQFVPKGATMKTAEPYDFFNLWLAFWRREQQRIRKERMEEARKKLKNKSDVMGVKLKSHDIGFVFEFLASFFH